MTGAQREALEVDQMPSTPSGRHENHEELDALGLEQLRRGHAAAEFRQAHQLRADGVKPLVLEASLAQCLAGWGHENSFRRAYGASARFLPSLARR